jgi:hypothetical protein
MDFSNFYTLVLTIAIVVLILLLGYVGWLMSKQQKTDEFPKLRASCPDYWKVETGDAGKVYCVRPTANDALNKGSNDWATGASGVDAGVTKFDTTNVGWGSAGNSVCAKQKWANSHGITWDTVTNANFC